VVLRLNNGEKKEDHTIRKEKQKKQSSSFSNAVTRIRKRIAENSTPYATLTRQRRNYSRLYKRWHEQQCNKETKKNITPSCQLMQTNATSLIMIEKEHNLYRHRIPRNTRREKSCA
jgi:predicted nuclease with TOPRIM domain